jgi:molecular chaperone DnaK (HSP70)
MFRSKNEPGLKSLLAGTGYAFCQDPITKLVAVTLHIDPTMIITVETIFRSIIEKMQLILQEKLNKIAGKAVVLVPMMFTSTQRSDFQKCLIKAGFKSVNLR